MVKALLRLYVIYSGRSLSLSCASLWHVSLLSSVLSAYLSHQTICSTRWKTLSIPHHYIPGVRTSINVCWMCRWSKYVSVLLLLYHFYTNIIGQGCKRDVKWQRVWNRSHKRASLYSGDLLLLVCEKSRRIHLVYVCWNTKVASRGQLPHFFPNRLCKALYTLTMN